MAAGDDGEPGPEYLTETAARHAAKLVGGGSLFIIRPDGTKYHYHRQPWE